MKINLVRLLCNRGVCKTFNEARRLIHQGGIRIDGDVVVTTENTNVMSLTVEKGKSVQVGKRGISSQT